MNVGKIVKMAKTLEARYLDKIILKIEIGCVTKSSNVPDFFSSAKHLIVKAGNRNINMPGACEKKVCKLDSPISIILFNPGKIQTKKPEVIKKTHIAT